MNSFATARFEHPNDIAATTAAAPEKLTYSAAEAAVLLGVSRPTVYRLLVRRVLIPIPGLRHKRIPKKQVRRLVEAKIRSMRSASERYRKQWAPQGTNLSRGDYYGESPRADQSAPA